MSKRSHETNNTGEAAPLPASGIGRMALKLFNRKDYDARLQASNVAAFKEAHREQLIGELANQSELLGRINTLLGATGQQPANHYDFSASLARTRVRATLPDGGALEVFWGEGDRQHSKTAIVGMIVRNEASAYRDARLRNEPRSGEAPPTDPHTVFYRFRPTGRRQPPDSLRGILGYDIGIVTHERNGFRDLAGRPAEYDYRYGESIGAHEPLNTLRDNWAALCSAAGLGEETPYAGPLADDTLIDATTVDDTVALRNTQLIPQGYGLKIAYF